MDKFEKLQLLLKEANNNVTYEELLNMFEKLGSHIVKVDTALVKKIDNKIDKAVAELGKLKNEFEQIITEARADSNKTFSGIRQRWTEIINRLFARNEINKKLGEKINEVNKKISEIDNKLTQVKDGYSPVKGVDYEDGKPGEDGKDAEVDYEKIIKEVMKKIPKGRGGGTSAMGVAHTFKYIAHTEQPVGAIDGVNTTFTVSHDIFWIAGFTLNNQVIAELPNFTWSGKTITFDIAPPAVFSGKDFEVKYIGA